MPKRLFVTTQKGEYNLTKVFSEKYQEWCKKHPSPTGIRLSGSPPHMKRFSASIEQEALDQDNAIN